MATFDTLIDDLAGRFGLGGSARALVEEVLAVISASPGGLAGVLDTLKSEGLASEAESWLGHPDAAPIARRASRARARRGGGERHCRTPGPRTGRRLDCARIRLAEDRRPPDAGRRRSRWRSPGGRGFSRAAASRGGAGRAEADRGSSPESAERIERRSAHPSPCGSVRGWPNATRPKARNAGRARKTHCVELAAARGPS